MHDDRHPFREGNEEERLVNAVRPILSELTKICRYENRAAARRNRAIREILPSKPRTSSFV
jgi:hypothetical protein